MVRRYNLKQITLAVFSFACGVFCYFLAWAFFTHLPRLIAYQFGLELPGTVALAIVITGLAAVTLTGYRTWRAGGGLKGYHESALYHERDVQSGGSLMVDIYAHRITGSAHILSQIFLAGPLGILKSRTLIASLLPTDAEHERRLRETLSILRSANRWQSINDHPGKETEIYHLAQMGEIDFSAAKGTPRIKAHLD